MIGNYKIVVIGISLAVAIGFGAYYLVNKVESLAGEVAVTQEKVKTLTTELDSVKKESEAREARMNQYAKMNNVSLADLDKKLAQFNKAREREAVIAAKPGLVTIIAKKQNKEFEDRLACLTGSLEYCSQ